MIYCPECGATNSDQATECTQCETLLPKLNASTPHPTAIPSAEPQSASPTPFTPEPMPPASWWQRLRPDLRSAILSSFVVSGLQSVSNVIPGLGFVLSTPFTITAYYAQGILAAKLAKDDPRYKPSDYIRLGATSALWTSVVFSTVLKLVWLTIFLGVSLGGYLTVIPIILALHLADIFLNVVFSVLGAWLYRRSGGKGVLGISIVVIVVGITLVCVLSIAILAMVGLTLPNLFEWASGFLS